MRPNSTRTAIFGLFVVAGRKLAASQVIALARPLGIAAGNVKSHLTRMVAEGALQRSGPPRLARYWPSEGQGQIVEAILARLQKPAGEPWQGEWMILALRMPAKRSDRERLKSSLWFDGFRPWTGDTWIRPAWPTHWAIAKANAYLEQGAGLCLRGSPLQPISTKLIAQVYQLDLLDGEAHKLATRIRERRISGPPARAFAQRLYIGGMVARLMGHDPRLPPALWDGRTGLRALVTEFRRFEARVGPVAQRFLKSSLSLR